MTDDKYYLMNKIGTTNHNYTTMFLNQNKDSIESSNCYQLYIDGKSNLMFIPIECDNSKYVISVMNYNLDKEQIEFISIIKEAMTVVLNNYELYNRMQKLSSIDNMTGTGNRYAYNQRISDIELKHDDCVYAIFDLFRLKYINDNYSHLLGDNYIVKAAEILKKYFPKYRYLDDNGNVKKEHTGTCVYRIGGDEFVVITNSLDVEKVKEKIKKVVEEVKIIDFNIEGLKLGLNYGIAKRENDETMESVYLRADKALSLNKTEMYRNLNIDRRR